MLCPNNIFIDTSIFDGQAFNFASAAFESFSKAAAGKNLTLLLPDPIEREIRKHIVGNARAALKALREAKRKAPFVYKWDQWPKEKSEWISECDLRDIAFRELSQFQETFRLIKLGYEHVHLPEVMDWYHQERAPFGTKNGKQKEFPDAFALAAVVAYAKREKAHVGVISGDSDFQGACEHYSELFYFPSLAAITEAILRPDERITEIKEVLRAQVSKLAEPIKEGFTELSFYPEEDTDVDVQDVSVENVQVTDVKVVSMGDHECSVAFEAIVSYSAYVCYDDPDSLIVDSSEDVYVHTRKKKGTVRDSSDISGLSKLRFDSSWQAVEDIISLSLDDDEVCVIESPPVEDDRAVDDYRACWTRGERVDGVASRTTVRRQSLKI